MEPVNMILYGKVFADVIKEIEVDGMIHPDYPGEPQIQSNGS
jgi:hypothetical protein